MICPAMMIHDRIAIDFYFLQTTHSMPAGMFWLLNKKSIAVDFTLDRNHTRFSRALQLVGCRST